MSGTVKGIACLYLMRDETVAARYIYLFVDGWNYFIGQSPILSMYFRGEPFRFPLKAEVCMNAVSARLGAALFE